MKQRMALFAAAMGVFAMTTLLSGCSDQTKDAAGAAVKSADQDAANHVSAAGAAVKEGAKEAVQPVKDAGAAVKEGAKEAVQPVKDAANAAGAAVQNADEKAKAAIVNTGAAVKEGAKEVTQPIKNAAAATGAAVVGAGAAVKEGAKETGHVVRGAGAALTMTPTIKTAIGAAGVDTAGINVDTIAATKMITINGTVKTAADKASAIKAASAAVAKSGEHYKIEDKLTVAP